MIILFRSFDDEGFTRVMVVDSLKELSKLELLSRLEERRFPCRVVSSLVNVQRNMYDLPYNSHKSYSEVKDDAVIKLEEFNSEDLRLVLLSLVAELQFMVRNKDFSVRFSVTKVIETLTNSRGYMSDWNGYSYSLEDFIFCLDNIESMF